MMDFTIVDEEDPYWKILSLIKRKGMMGEIDAAAFYCPYIPLTMSGCMPDAETYSAYTQLAASQNLYFASVTSFNTRYGPVSVPCGTLDDITVVRVPLPSNTVLVGYKGK